MRSHLAVVAAAVALVAAGASAAGLREADDSAKAFEGALGPELPAGLNCDVNMGTLGEEGAGLMSFPQWIASLRTAVSAGSTAKANEGIARLCGSRLQPDTVAFHAAAPAPSSPSGQALGGALGDLKAACDASDALKFKTAFFTVCPTPGSLGPSMPDRCDATAPDPRRGEESARPLRLPLFLTVLRDVIQADGPASDSDETWRRGVRSLCGRRAEVSGVGFHSHRPIAGTPLFRDVSQRVSSLVEACGAAERDPALYQASWEALCPASPEAEVVSLEDSAKGDALAGAVQRYRAAVEAAKLLATKAEAMSVGADAAGAADESVKRVGTLAQGLLGKLQQWKEAEADREPSFENSC